jgi:7-cyano-7-deazaguanine synthase
MRGILLVSGGLDSSTLLYDRLQAGEMIDALFVDYGQRMAEHEERAAQAVCSAAGVHLHSVKARLPTPLGAGWLSEPPDQPNWDDHLVTHWPHRNLFLTTLAAMLATNTGAQRIYLGFMDIQKAPFPDATPEFLSGLEAVLRLTDSKLELKAPFITWTKRQVATRALQLQVPVDFTFSCTYAVDHHCCQCPSCLDRLDALEYARTQANSTA